MQLAAMTVPPPQAGGIILVNRFKPHPAFRGSYECGLKKMLTIGLGKQKVAEACQHMGFHNIGRNVEMFDRCLLENAKVIEGLDILENAYDQTKEDGDLSEDNIHEKTLQLLVSKEELAKRRLNWTPPALKYTRGYLAKYANEVSFATEGAITSRFS